MSTYFKMKEKCEQPLWSITLENIKSYNLLITSNKIRSSFGLVGYFAGLIKRFSKYKAEERKWHEIFVDRRLEWEF